MWKIEELGIIDYKQAFEYQESLVARKLTGEKDNFFLLLEHPPTFTRGKAAKENNILDKTIPVFTTNRGGDLTYHEPGQLVGYIILDLRVEKLRMKDYLGKIEDLIINSLKTLDIHANKNPAGIISNMTGVWLEGKKVASIGVGLRQGITMHGFALNVANSLGGFQKINPCGLKSENYSSLNLVTNKCLTVCEVSKVIVKEFQHLF